jgi:hypothetical protein
LADCGRGGIRTPDIVVVAIYSNPLSWKPHLISTWSIPWNTLKKKNLFSL